MNEKSFPQLTHSPLREALVDIRLSADLPTSWVAKLEKANFNGFDNSQPMKQGAFKLEMPPDQPARAVVTADQALGRRYDRIDNARVLQVRRNGMTFSVLKNYTKWHDLRDAAELAWRKYLEISGSVSVSRLAVRYINGIELRLGSDYDEYLTAGPRIPESLPQVVNNFIQRVQVPFEKQAAMAIITQTSEGPVDAAAYAILDIDVFAQCSLDSASPELWPILDDLRVIANDIFFASITPKLLESYR